MGIMSFLCCDRHRLRDPPAGGPCSFRLNLKRDGMTVLSIAAGKPDVSATKQILSHWKEYVADNPYAQGEMIQDLEQSFGFTNGNRCADLLLDELPEAHRLRPSIRRTACTLSSGSDSW